MTNYDILKEYEAHKTPVPSYEEWQNLLLDNKILKQCQEIDFGTAYTETVKTKAENQQLKELLKECREEIDRAKSILTEDTSIDNTVVAHAVLRKLLTKIDNAIGENNGN